MQYLTSRISPSQVLFPDDPACKPGSTHVLSPELTAICSGNVLNISIWQYHQKHASVTRLNGASATCHTHIPTYKISAHLRQMCRASYFLLGRPAVSDLVM